MHSALGTTKEFVMMAPLVASNVVKMVTHESVVKMSMVMVIGEIKPNLLQRLL